MKSFLLVVAIAVQAYGQFVGGNWRTDTSKTSIDLGQLQRGGPPKDGIPSIDKPRFLPASNIDWLAPTELVIAVRLDGSVRAYPLQILMWHELVNDRIAENPILVSYCPLCNSAVVYDRRLGDATLEFGVSGMLRNSDMVMFDRQTESLWQQITGDGIVGTHTGSTLRVIPSQMIPFDQFKESFPGGMVLTRETGFQRDYGRNPYRGYEFGSGPIVPVSPSRATSLRPMEKLVVLKDGSGYRAYPVSRLARRGVIEEKVNGRQVVFFYSPDGLSPVDATNMQQSRSVGSIGVFSVETGAGKIRFRKAGGQIEDRETSSVWSVSGIAVAGKRKGTALRPIEHGVYFAFAWLAFKPDTLVVGDPPVPLRVPQ